MTLKQCTKEELIRIINDLQTRCENGEYYTDRALNDIQYEHQRKEIKEAERWAQISHDATMEFVRVMKLHDGLPLSEIPIWVLERARELIETQKRADKEFNRLMHIDTGG